MTNYPLEEERKFIRQVKETITASVVKAPMGWLGPGGGIETFNTPDHLTAEGFEYLCDWGCEVASWYYEHYYEDPGQLE
jgi:hypothetical protein